MTGPRIDGDACKRCCACVEVCPQGIFGRRPGGEGGAEISIDPERAQLCISCGHCMAVCPAEAVHAGSLEYGKDVVEPGAAAFGAESFQVLLKTRRACRAYKDEPVPREAAREGRGSDLHSAAGIPKDNEVVGALILG